MRPAEALSASPQASGAHGKLLAEAHTLKPPAATIIGYWVLITLGVMSMGSVVFTVSGGAPLVVSGLMIVIGLAMFVPGFLKVRAHGRKSGQLRVFERGVEVTNSKGEKLLATYEELEGVGFEEKELLTNGSHNGWLRTLVLWAKGQRMTLMSHIIGGDGDAFGTALNLLLKNEAEQTTRSLAAGEVLRGDGWQLDRNGVKLENGMITPLESFVQTGVNEGRAQAWRKGEEEPFFNVAVGSRNARTALGVIARHLPESEEARKVPGLGRRLFTKGMSRMQKGVWLGLAIFFVVPALIGFAVKPEPGILVSVALGGLFFAIYWFGAKGGTNIHERGVRQKGITGLKELRFSDVEVYTHATTRHFYNGAYTGTSHNLQFLPLPGKGKRISLNLMARGTDEDMEKLRDSMARIVAHAMYERVMGGARVRWSGSELSREGIHYNESKLIGKGAAGMLPYAGSRYSFDQGQCFLYPPTGNKHVTAISCAGPNFFPGFELYQLLCNDAQSGQVVRPTGVGRP